MKELYSFQQKAVDSCMNYLSSSSKDPVCVVIPTSGGKSLIISEVAKRIGKNILVLQPSIELLKQNLEEAKELGVDNISVYSAGMKLKELGGDVTFATLGSIKKDVKELKKLGIDIVCCDEIHYKFSEVKGSEFRTFMKELAPKKVIGFTATPYKPTSTKAGVKLKMLNRLPNKFIKDIIHVTQIKEIIDGGFWTPINYEIHTFDGSGLILNSTASDFTDESVKEVLKAEGVNNNTYLRVKKLLADGYTSILVFVDCVETAKKMVEYVPNSTYVSADTLDSERAERVSKFKSGEINVMFNYGVYTTGFNFPALQVVILSRPTNSLALYYQIVGRVVRLFKGKSIGLFIDFCGNYSRFGRVEDQEIVDYPGHGWSVFREEILITNVFLNGLYKVTKTDINSKRKFVPFGESVVLSFGKFEGKTVQQIKKSALWYLTFIYSNFEFNTPDKVMLKEEIEIVLKEDAISG